MSLSSNATSCPTCGSTQAVDARYCTHCGAPLSGGTQAAPNRPSSAVGAAVAACAVHPEIPALKPCPRCGTFACAQCLVLGPTGEEYCRACEARAAPGLPWDRKAELGTLKAFWQTCWLLLSQPMGTLARTAPQGSVGSSLHFAVLASLAGFTTTIMFYVLIFAGIGASIAGSKAGRSELAIFGAMGVGMFIVAVVLYFGLLVVGGIVGAMLMALLEHVSLKLVGAKPASWETSLRAHVLGMAPYILGLIPFCSLYVFPIWSIVLRIFSYRALHRISTGKAVAAVLIPIGAFLCLIVSGYAVLFAVIAATGGLDS